VIETETARQLPCAISWVAPLRHRYHVSVGGKVVASAQSGDAAVAYAVRQQLNGIVRYVTTRVTDSQTGGLLFCAEAVGGWTDVSS
jgi:hypothetical protein